MDPKTLLLILSVLDHLIVAIGLAPVVKRDLAGVLASVRQMVSEGREPTVEEWSRLNGRINASAERLRAANELLST